MFFAVFTFFLPTRFDFQYFLHQSPTRRCSLLPVTFGTSGRALCFPPPFPCRLLSPQLCISRRMPTCVEVWSLVVPPRVAFLFCRSPFFPCPPKHFPRVHTYSLLALPCWCSRHGIRVVFFSSLLVEPVEGPSSNFLPAPSRRLIPFPSVFAPLEIPSSRVCGVFHWDAAAPGLSSSWFVFPTLPPHEFCNPLPFFFIFPYDPLPFQTILSCFPLLIKILTTGCGGFFLGVGGGGGTAGGIGFLSQRLASPFFADFSCKIW